MADRWMRNCWQVAAYSHEVAGGQLLARRICGEDLVFFRSSKGEPVAFEDKCPHRFAPLSKGVLMGDVLRCGYHGLCFDTTGKCIEIPGQAYVPPRARVRAFPVVERHRLLWVWMGEAERADALKVPDIHWLDDPAWVAAEGYHRIEANFRLLNDNLLDLSHETYVHQRTIGHEAVAESPVAIEADERSVRIVKEMPGCTPPPFYQVLGRLKPTDRIDRWQRTVYEPPGIIVLDVGVNPLDAPPGSNRVEGRVINLMTPETETSTHYFWAFARNFRLDEPGVTEFLRANVGRTFDEDKVMLESQQRNLGDADAASSAFTIAIKADVGPTQGRRLLASLIEAESRGA
ncbi:MAG TPA: aromatic ring-hydroxylating dioxygenase subunit alpha [Casimicrobiaceae bacterium]|nr:aromatic ring-hydroxylating dioxygenase subunit alpha [Casimicrobiaceae bacterium]